MNISGLVVTQSINLALNFVSKMAFKWRAGDYYTKQKIQFLLFPSGIGYSKKTDGCRTSRINFVFLYIAYLQQVIGNKKSGIPELNLDFAAFACLVAESERFSTQFVDDLTKLSRIDTLGMNS